MYSRELNHIVSEAQRLKKKYLDFSDEGAISIIEENQEKLRIFQILLHAEFECYFEDLALNRLKELESNWLTLKWNDPINWNDSTKWGDSLFQGLMLFSPAEYVGNPNQCDPISRVNFLMSQLKHKISNNHGIKECDIYSMLLPTGVPLDAFPSMLIPNLNSFGGVRGYLAHRSKNTIPKTHVRKVVLSKIAQILWDIRSLEKSLRKINPVSSA